MKVFGISKFAESILEVADNLQRALESSSSSAESKVRGETKVSLLVSNF